MISPRPSEPCRTRPSNARWLEHLLDGWPGLVWEASADSGELNAIGGQVAPLTGLAADAWLGADGGLARQIPEPDRSKWASELHNLGPDKPQVSIEHDLVDARGRRRRLRSDVRLHPDHAGRLAQRGLSIDVTDAARLQADLARQLEEMGQLRDLTRRAVDSRDPDELFAQSCAMLHRWLDADGVLVLEQTPAGGCRVHSGSETLSRIERDSSESRLPIVERTTVVTKVDVEEACVELADRGFRTAVLSPIARRDPPAVLAAYWRSRDPIPSDADGKVDAVAGLLTAACERRTREVEQIEQQRERAIGALAVGIAHDFSNVLGALGVGIENILSDLPEDAVADPELVSITRQALATGRDLTTQVLAYASPNHGRSSTVLDEAVFVGLRIAQLGLDRSIQIQSELASGVTVVADPSRLGQLVLNLLNNAARASQPGSTVRLETSRHRVTEEHEASVSRLRPGTYGVIRVSDAGRGIAPEDLARVFDPFFTTGAREATGVGLAIVRRIVVDELDGAIDIESEVDRGTVFTLYVPAEREMVDPASVDPSG